ncbi:hypothetical protein Tco_0374891 [Tanacetum coccineum]
MYESLLLFYGCIISDRNCFLNLWMSLKFINGVKPGSRDGSSKLTPSLDGLYDADDEKPSETISPSSFPIPVVDSGSFFKESDTSLSYSDNSLLEFETFSDHTEAGFDRRLEPNKSRLSVRGLLMVSRSPPDRELPSLCFAIGSEKKLVVYCALYYSQDESVCFRKFGDNKDHLNLYVTMLGKSSDKGWGEELISKRSSNVVQDVKSHSSGQQWSTIKRQTQKFQEFKSPLKQFDLSFKLIKPLNKPLRYGVRSDLL